MAIDLQPLVDRFYDYFLDLYHRQRNDDVSGAHADTAKAGEAFLAFGGMGAGVTPEMFLLQDGSPSTGLVREQFSSLANMLPELEGTTITSPGLLSADGVYGLLLAQAMPMTADEMAGLGAIRDPALRAYEEAAEDPMIRGGVEYRPALPMPPDWPLQAGEAGWSSYSYHTEEKTSVTPPPPAGTIRPTVDWRWRFAPPALQDTVKSLGTVATTVAPKPAPAPTPSMQARIAMLRTPVALVRRPAAAPAPATITAVRPQLARMATSGTMALHAPAAPAAVATARPALAELVQSRVLLQQLQAVRAQSQPQAVTSTSMELSFRYCMVTARRPWISTAFLTARNWYVPRMRAGEISSGTGLGNGTFEVMPTVALCVRDLRITAAWSAEERAVLPAMTKFGPFSLVGSKLDANAASLLCPGMQIIGWVMEPMPMLPPNGDPALPPPPPTGEPAPPVA